MIKIGVISAFALSVTSICGMYSDHTDQKYTRTAENLMLPPSKKVKTVYGDQTQYRNGDL